MPITFSPKVAFHGFDRTAAWQTVPVNGERVLTITGHGTRVPRVRSDKANVLTAVQTVSGAVTQLKLTGGNTAGKAFVDWVPSATFAGTLEVGFTLEVSVKAVKEINTAFHYVNDGKVQVTARRIADLDPLIVATNVILCPQANVIIKRKSAAPLAMAQDLGAVVKFAAHLTGPPDNVPAAEDEWDDFKAKRDTTADFNVFFVKEYEQDNTPATDNVDAGTIASDKMCIFEDNIGHPVDEEFAHETVHVLGVSAHSAGNTFLMATGASGIGRFIDRAQANTINPSGT